jgi:plastocyanin
MRSLVLTLIVGGVLAGTAISTATASTTAIVHMSAPASGLKYDQKIVRAHAGRIKIVFLNRSAIKHNVNIEQGEHEFGKSATVSHATTTFFVSLKAGKYNVYCSVPGHEDAGMHGTLIVS